MFFSATVWGFFPLVIPVPIHQFVAAHLSSQLVKIPRIMSNRQVEYIYMAMVGQNVR